jgi:hypothetical protein
MASPLQVRAVELFAEESEVVGLLDDRAGIDELEGFDGLATFDASYEASANDETGAGVETGAVFPLPPPPSSLAGALERLRALGVGLRSAREVAGAALQAATPEGSANPADSRPPRHPLPSLPLLPSLPSLPSSNPTDPRRQTAVPASPEAAPSLQAPWAPAGPEPLATAVPALDELLAGGLPRGKLVEMVGARSSGRFSAVLAILAAATVAGEAAALVDLGDGFDPQTAATFEMDLRRLLWLRPASLKQALVCAEVLLGGGFPLVVLDLGSPPVRGGRGGEAGWVRLARAAQAHRAALLVASPYRVSGTAAAIVLQAAPGRALWQGVAGRAPWLLDGLSCQLALEKCRGRLLPAQRSRRLELRLEDTISLDAPDPSTATGDLPGVPATVDRPAGRPAKPRLASSASAPADPARSVSPSGTARATGLAGAATAATSNSARSAGSTHRASRAK